MPVIINTLQVRARVDEDAGAAPAAGPPSREALVDEVAQAVLDRLERHLERLATRR